MPPLLSNADNIPTFSVRHITGKKSNEAMTYPLLHIPNEPCQLNSKYTLSGLFPGVDHLLSKVQPTIHSLPLLTDNAVNKSMIIPFPASVFPHFHVGPGKHADDCGHATVDTGSPHSIDRELPSVQLPDVPIRPFIPQLIFPKQQETCMLLTVNDRLSQMKDKGFALLTVTDKQNCKCARKSIAKQKIKLKKKRQWRPTVELKPTADSNSATEKISSSFLSSLSNLSHSSVKDKAIDTGASESIVQQPLEHASVGVQVELSQESPQPLILSIQSPIMPTTASVETQTEVYQIAHDCENNIDLEKENLINSDISKYENENCEHVDGTSDTLKKEPNYSPYCYISVSDVEESDAPCDTPYRSPSPLMESAMQNADHNSIPLGEYIDTMLESDSVPSSSPVCTTHTQQEFQSGSDDMLQQLKNLELQILLLEHTANDVEKDFATSHKVI